MKNINIALLESILEKSWSKETCFPFLQKDWTPENPALGQCMVTVLIVHDYFGGEILRCKHHHHYWNRLPNNAEIDITQSQFRNNEKICSDEVIKRNYDPNSKFNKEAKTIERYEILKNRVQDEIKKAKKINTFNSNNIYLTSSNAADEYVLDIVEILSSPFGFVHHFRYQLMYLDNELKSKLPKKDCISDSYLIDNKVTICYLYQELKEGVPGEWKRIYPVRTGSIVNAYISGDIAHFYFRVENYISYHENKDFTEIIKINADDKYGKYYAFMSQTLEAECIKEKTNSMFAFHETCESLKIEHFRSQDGKKQYFPCFCYIDGLRDENGQIVNFEYRKNLNKSYCEIYEGEYYSFNFSTYFVKDFKKEIGTLAGSIKLIYDEKIFSSPKEYELKISSRYDEEYWIIASSLLKRDVWTKMTLQVSLSGSHGYKGIPLKPLEMSLDFPVKVKRKIIFRIIDALAVLGFGIGTAAIALTKVFEEGSGGFAIWYNINWYYIVITAYFTWAISLFIIKITRE